MRSSIPWFAAALLPAAAFAQAPASVSGSPVGTTPDAKIHCKRYTETGSLAKVRKECHTDAEWRAIADANRDELRNNFNRSGALGTGPQ